MAIDLKSMSRKELEKHLKDVQKALTTVQARELKDAKKAAEKAAAEFGFTLNEITGTKEPAPKPKTNKPKASGPKSKPKFANPENPKQTWTGKGRQPKWYRAHIENGVKAEAMQL